MKMAKSPHKKEPKIHVENKIHDTSATTERARNNGTTSKIPKPRTNTRNIIFS